MLKVKDLTLHYGGSQILYDVSLTAAAGEVTCIMGTNGVGKTSLLKAVSGTHQRTSGEIEVDGEAIGKLPAHALAQKGIGYVPQGRMIFPLLTVKENMETAYACLPRSEHYVPDEIYELFPILEERKHQASTSLSGGQQQMVAIGRALMSNPDLILFDEISLGLAPIIIKDIYDALPGIVGGGMSAVIVEQDVTKALAVSSRVYCLQEGRVSLEGNSQTVSRDEISRAYFGIE